MLCGCHQQLLPPAAPSTCSMTSWAMVAGTETMHGLNNTGYRDLSCTCCSVTQLCPTLCDPMDCSTPGFPVLHHLLEFAQNHVHWVDDAIQPSHPLSSPSHPTLDLSQHQGLFQWVSSSHQVAKVLELQPQHQSFQWVFIGLIWKSWFPLGLTGLISLLSKVLSRVFSSTTVWKQQFFGAQPYL